MTYTGRVEKGVVVFEGDVKPPDGSRVRVELDASGSPVGESLDKLAGKAVGLPADLADKHDEYARQKLEVSTGGSIWDDLRAMAGMAQGLPEDMADNHDHYIHGADKRKPG